MSKYPKVKDVKKVGSYPVVVKAGGGFVWDAVLEYRVWCHPEKGVPNLHNGSDYFYSFKTYEEAFKYYKENVGSEEPPALILQKEYINEPQPGNYVYVKEQRLTEWAVKFLNRPKRNKNALPTFLAPNDPSNRLDIIRGLTK